MHSKHLSLVSSPTARSFATCCLPNSATRWASPMLLSFSIEVLLFSSSHLHILSSPMHTVMLFIPKHLPLVNSILKTTKLLIISENIRNKNKYLCIFMALWRKWLSGKTPWILWITKFSWILVIQNSQDNFARVRLFPFPHFPSGARVILKIPPPPFKQNLISHPRFSLCLVSTILRVRWILLFRSYGFLLIHHFGICHPE